MFTIILLSLNLKAANHFLLIGGGGEKGPSTIFDNSSVKTTQYFHNQRWETSVVFGKRTFDAYDELEKYASTPAVPFVQGQAEDAIQNLIEKIKTGKIAAGEKILININTHGAPGMGSLHRVLMADGNFFFTDKLLNLRDAIKEAGNGIKLGIIDASCYSGASLELADENTCVITGADANFVSTNTFGNKISSALTPGDSMEGLFLRVRPQSTWGYGGSPQISTTAGKTLYEKLAVLAPYTIPGSDLGMYYGSMCSVQGCDRHKDNTQSFAANMKELIAHDHDDLSSIKDLPTNVQKRYKEVLSQRGQYRNRFNSAQRHKVQFERLVAGEPEWKRLIESPLTVISKDQSVSETEGRIAQDELRKLEALAKSNTRFRQALQHHYQYQAQTQETNLIATKLLTLERQLYRDAYPTLQKASSKKEPCQEFKL